MSAARYNLIIDQGTDFALEFIVKESGTAKNLSGYNARAQLRPTKDSSTLTETFTCTIQDGSVTGKIKAALTSRTIFLRLRVVYYRRHSNSNSIT